MPQVEQRGVARRAGGGRHERVGRRRRAVAAREPAALRGLLRGPRLGRGALDAASDTSMALKATRRASAWAKSPTSPGRHPTAARGGEALVGVGLGVRRVFGQVAQAPGSNGGGRGYRGVSTSCSEIIHEYSIQTRGHEKKVTGARWQNFSAAGRQLRKEEHAGRYSIRA